MVCSLHPQWLAHGELPCGGCRKGLDVLDAACGPSVTLSPSIDGRSSNCSIDSILDFLTLSARPPIRPSSRNPWALRKRPSKFQPLLPVGSKIWNSIRDSGHADNLLLFLHLALWAAVSFTFILTEGAVSGPMQKDACGPLRSARALGSCPDCLGGVAKAAFYVALLIYSTFPG